MKADSLGSAFVLAGGREDLPDFCACASLPGTKDQKHEERGCDDDDDDDDQSRGGKARSLLRCWGR
jgi:hypothetical protein